VILAAVIATFVLGLGEQVSQTAPQASFSFDYDSEAGNITISHDGGDTIEAQNLKVSTESQSFNTSPAGATTPSPDEVTQASFDEFEYAFDGATSEVTAGDTLLVSEHDSDSDFDVVEMSVTFQSTEGDASATLGEFTGPDA
jgi:FlaG/FlaF family flagellin (archaellin)